MIIVLLQVQERVFAVEDLSVLTSSSNSTLAVLRNSGDSQAISQFVSSVSRALNTQAGGDEQQQAAQRIEVHAHVHYK